MVPISKVFLARFVIYQSYSSQMYKLPIEYDDTPSCEISTNVSNIFGRYCDLFLKGEVFVLSKRFFLKCIVVHEIVHSFILWNLTYFRWKLCEICRLKIFYWTRFLFYRSNFRQIQTEPLFYNNQASCQILLKSVKNFLSNIDHRATEPQTEPQTESQTHTSKTIPISQTKFGAR